MHMADALISPAVGGTMWAATAGTIAYCSRKVNLELDDRKIALMGVLGAFIFAVQMINFTIPATGSSGHLGGGMILAILLGPYAAFLVMASVLTVQALFFADGGLLALGCNIFNLAFFPCFIAYPFIYKKIVGAAPTEKRIVAGALLSAVVGLQLGSLGVVIQTVVSGVAELPFTTFVLLMQPIHLAIGIVEGIVTSTVVIFVWKARPEILQFAMDAQPLKSVRVRNVAAGLLVAAVVTGGALSWLASSHPDGLEWSISGITGKKELDVPEQGIRSDLAALQEKAAVLPDYGFRKAGDDKNDAGAAEEAPEQWPAVDGGTTTSGLIGGFITLLIAGGIGLLLKRRNTPT
jgi:cobalt/nickel transport system permease protein